MSTWNISEKVKIIKKPNTSQGWVTFGDVTESMRDWAIPRSLWDNSSKKYTPNPERDNIDKYIFEYDNSDFTFELYDCAEGSSQGGKLSFWNCKISKGNEEFIVGINTELLFDVLKNNSFIKGVCQSKVCFISRSGQIGITTKSSDNYKEAMSYVSDRDSFKTKKKTSKWEKGKFYYTATKSDTLISEMYKMYEFIDSGYNRRRIQKIKEPIKEYLIENEEIIGDKDIKSYFSSKGYPYILDKLPSRAEKPDKTISVLTSNDIEDIIHSVRKKDMDSKYQFSYTSWAWWYSPYPDKAVSFTSEEEQWLKDKGYKFIDG